MEAAPGCEPYGQGQRFEHGTIVPTGPGEKVDHAGARSGDRGGVRGHTRAGGAVEAHRDREGPCWARFERPVNEEIERRIDRLDAATPVQRLAEVSRDCRSVETESFAEDLIDPAVDVGGLPLPDLGRLLRSRVDQRSRQPYRLPRSRARLPFRSRIDPRSTGPEDPPGSLPGTSCRAFQAQRSPRRSPFSLKARNRVKRIFVNGVEGAGIPGDDPGLTRGLSVFETLRTYRFVPFRLEAHLQRLRSSAARFGIQVPARLSDEIVERLEPDSIIRITLTAGRNRVIEVSPIDPDYRGRPVSVALVDGLWSDSLPGEVKHGSRAAWILAARQHGVDEVIFCDRSGCLLEANRSNLFAVVAGCIRTPPTDGRILPGITREVIIEAAKRDGLPIEIAPIKRFEELYLSSSLKEFSPAVLEGRTLEGEMGPRIQQALTRLIEEEVRDHEIQNQRKPQPERPNSPSR